MPDSTACAICHGPLLGRMPAIIAGKPAYVCARCGTAPRIGSSPPLPPGQVQGSGNTKGPARCAQCVGPQGVTNFLNELVAREGAPISSLAQVMIGLYKPPPADGDGGGGGEYGALPVILVTAIMGPRPQPAPIMQQEADR